MILQSIIIAIIAPFIAIGIKFISDILIYNNFYKKIWKDFQTQPFIFWDKAGNTQLIHIIGSKIARVDFERFLNLYKISPEKWIIKTNKFVPVYNNNNDYIPLFWTNAKELKKYAQWLQNNFALGENSGCEQARNESLKKLNNHLQEDLKEKRAEFEKEMAEFEEQFKQDRERAKEKYKIELKLEPETKP